MPEESIINQGKIAEDLVENICQKVFLKDFIVRNPKFRKLGGEEKEVADFLIPFGSTLIAFQVKSRKETNARIDQEETERNRIMSRIYEGIGQLNTLRRALNAGQLKTITNQTGIEIPFVGGQDTSIFGIVIMELFGEDKLGEDKRTAIYNGYCLDHHIPTHIFTRQVFETISTEIDTIPDLLDYLAIQKSLYEKGILLPLTHELDFLALYKTRPDLIKQTFEDDISILILDELWSDYRTAHLEQIDSRNLKNRPSYLIDGIIMTLHAGIGFDPGIEIPINLTQSKPNTAGEYYSAIFELASLTRLRRRVIGEKFLDKMRKAEQVEFGYSLIKIKNDSAVFILAMDAERQIRLKQAWERAAIAYCGLGLRKIIIIATEPYSAIQRSFDVGVLEDMEFENADELASKYSRVFGKEQRGEISEY